MILILITLFIIYAFFEGNACAFWTYSHIDLDLNNTLPIPYTTLPSTPGSLRTLLLLPGSGSEPIMCELESTQLLDNPHYEALLYHWGDQTQLKAVLINGVKVAVTSNLRFALSSRDKDNPRMLWVDARCIDQQDDKEKSRQVANIALIYQRASSVIVHLSEHQPYNSLHKYQIIDYVQQAALRVVERFLKNSVIEKKGPRQLEEWEVQNTMQPEIDHAEHDAKLDEMAIDYFLRSIVYDDY